VESAIQNATATPPPVSTSGPAAQAVSATPPAEGVSKTPLANPSHVESLRKEAAGTIEPKQVTSLAKG
jgi:hypothetical protein